MEHIWSTEEIGELLGPRMVWAPAGRIAAGAAWRSPPWSRMPPPLGAKSAGGK